jgi:thiol-disulfide isomerase/thioredoxin
MKRSAVILATALLAACGGGEAGGGKAVGYGRRPDWSITLPDGKKVSAADYDNKVLILDFWATWCPPCKKEVPGFIELQKKYADKGLVIVGFSFDYDPSAHDVWVQEQKVNYLSIYMETDAGKAVVGQFTKQVGEISNIPTTLVIDRKGTIVHRHDGYGSPEDFEKVIAPLF